jgi:hypothetical protein
MTRADKAEVVWDGEKKTWRVRVQIGEEVIKRSLEGQGQNADEASLRAAALSAVKDDGYELDPGKVTVTR